MKHEDISTAIDETILRFESSWQSGNPVTIAECVPAESRANSDLLTELSCIDLEYRLKKGEQSRVESYVDEFPGLAEDERHLLELIRTEWLFRPDRDQIKLADFAARFPNVVSHLQAMFQAHADRNDQSQPVCDDVQWRCETCDVDIGSRSSAATSCPQCGERVAIDRYELLERVGEGAFGFVYRARDPKLNRVVALKIPRAQQFAVAEEAERFLREARNAAQLEHPGIVSIHDAGKDGETAYIVSDFVDGESLNELMQHREFTFRDSATLVQQISNAIAHAHERGVIHRDLKPANVMTVVGQGGGVQPRVMDFGLARASADASMTMDGQTLGTPAFMSPEQARGDLASVDVRSDVYSLGVILFQMLCGELPFRGSVQMLIQQVINDDPPSPARFRNSIPRDLETICLKCIERDPAERYSSANELSAELDRWLNGKPILARPISVAGKFVRWCKRRPAIAGLSAALSVALIGGLAGVTSQWLRAEENAKAYRLEAAENLQLATSESAAKEKAVVEEATAIAVNEFMNDVLAAARSKRNGRLPTILEAVDSAARRVGEKFKDRPRVEANVRYSIGRVYRGQGDGQAIPQFRRAIELFRELDGSDGIKTLKSMDRLAGALRALGDSGDDVKEALALRTEVVDRMTRTLGENHSDTLMALNNLALVYHRLDDFNGALEMYDRVLKGIDADPDATRKDRLITEHNIAIAKLAMGDLESAEVELRSIMKSYESLPDFRPGKDYFNSVNALADALFDRKQFGEAEAIYRKALEGRLKSQGPTHYATLDTENRIGRALLAAGKFELAEKESAEVLARRISEYYEASSKTVDVRENYFKALVGLERLADAETFLLDSWKAFSKKRGADDKYTVELADLLIAFYESHGMPDQLQSFEVLVEKAATETKPSTVK